MTRTTKVSRHPSAPMTREEIERRIDEFLAALRRLILLLVDAIQERR